MDVGIWEIEDGISQELGLKSFGAKRVSGLPSDHMILN